MYEKIIEGMTGVIVSEGSIDPSNTAKPAEDEYSITKLQEIDKRDVDKIQPNLDYKPVGIDEVQQILVKSLKRNNINMNVVYEMLEGVFILISTISDLEIKTLKNVGSLPEFKDFIWELYGDRKEEYIESDTSHENLESWLIKVSNGNITQEKIREKDKEELLKEIDQIFEEAISRIKGAYRTTYNLIEEKRKQNVYLQIRKLINSSSNTQIDINIVRVLISEAVLLLLLLLKFEDYDIQDIKELFDYVEFKEFINYFTNIEDKDSENGDVIAKAEFHPSSDTVFTKEEIEFMVESLLEFIPKSFIEEFPSKELAVKDYIDIQLSRRNS